MGKNKQGKKQKEGHKKAGNGGQYRKKKRPWGLKTKESRRGNGEKPDLDPQKEKNRERKTGRCSQSICSDTRKNTVTKGESAKMKHTYRKKVRKEKRRAKGNVPPTARKGLPQEKPSKKKTTKGTTGASKGNLTWKKEPRETAGCWGPVQAAKEGVPAEKKDRL